MLYYLMLRMHVLQWIKLSVVGNDMNASMSYIMRNHIK